MFGIWKSRQPEVHHHWWVAADGMQSNSEAFYQEIVEELERRGVPGVDASRLLMPQGALGAGSREYLRLRRERQVFDICSAPVGDSWFFSCRVAQIPFMLRLVELALLVVGFFFIFSIYPATFGVFWGGVAFAGTIFGLLALVNGFAAKGTQTADNFLLKVPVIGALYELFLRRNDTYYQEDMRLLCSSLVNHVVKEKVREFAAAGGIDDVDFQTNSNPTAPRGLRRQVWDTAMESTEELRAGVASATRKALDKLL